MAKAKAICTCAKCGATYEVEAFRANRRDADNWKSWAESHYDECPDCYKARMLKEREEANEKAAAESRNAGIPELSGSEKQIAWANKIRKDFIDDRFPLDKLTDRGRECLYDFLNQHTDSKFWIENRFNKLDIQDMIHDLWSDKYAEGKRFNSSDWYEKNPVNQALS